MDEEEPSTSRSDFPSEMADAAQVEDRRCTGLQAGNELKDTSSRRRMQQKTEAVLHEEIDERAMRAAQQRDVTRCGVAASRDPSVHSAEHRDTKQDILPIDDSIIDKLSDGFLQTFLPHSQCSSAVLDELMRNQRVLIETLEQENAKFKENKMMSDLSELMTEAKKYHSRLVHLRKEMISLHEKSTKLKKRALKLQHHKMKQNLQKEQQREREMEQEKHLIAKPAAKKTP